MNGTTAVSCFVVGSRHVSFARSPFLPCFVLVSICMLYNYKLSVESVDNLAIHNQRNNYIISIFRLAVGDFVWVF